MGKRVIVSAGARVMQWRRAWWKEWIQTAIRVLYTFE